MERLPNVKEQFSGGLGPGRSAVWQAAAQAWAPPPAGDAATSAPIAQPIAQDG